MINFLSLEFLFGIIIGCLIVMAIYQFTKKNNDNASLETKITAIKTLLDEIKTSDEIIVEACKEADVYSVVYEKKPSLTDRIGHAVESSLDNSILKWLHRSSRDHTS